MSITSEHNVMKAYKADKKFVRNYVSANIVEAALIFFGMDERNGSHT